VSLPWIATLDSPRPRERGVSFHGPTEEYVTSVATGWLEASGEAGDSFVVSEVVRRQVKVIVCEKAAATQAEAQWRHHAFVVGKSPAKCDRCNGTYEEHLK
jgi:hypothetical protein